MFPAWDNSDSGELTEESLCAGKITRVAAVPPGITAGHDLSAVVVGSGPGSQYIVAWADQAAALLGATITPYPGQVPGPAAVWRSGTCGRRLI